MKNSTIELLNRTFKTRFYKRNYSNAKIDAQSNLDSSTHYVDDDTLKAFDSKILKCLPADNGALLLIVESLPFGNFDAPRKKRAVVFDLSGLIVYKSDGLNSTAEKVAMVAYNDFITNFDVVAHYKELICSKIERNKSDPIELKTAIKGLNNE